MSQAVALLAAAGSGLLVALALGFAFVRLHLGPRLARLRALAASLEDQVASRTKDLVATNARFEEGLARIGNMQRQLTDASRRAGMADVATTVLHNVGNVLTSVNVSSSLVMDTVQKTPLVGLAKAVELLRTNQGDLAGFFAADGKGSKLVAYLAGLSAAEARERELVLRELELLQKNIDHIKVIVGRQQTYAKAVGTVEMVALAELIDDAINLQRATAAKQGIEIVSQLDELPPMRVDRHKVFQIVMNLLGNARQALADCSGGRRIAVRLVRRERSRIAIEVEDTGCGIAGENLTRIFSHGFTTKKDGHGFGLHGASCSAMELGGALTAQSDGPGTGARFTLELPLDPPSARAPVAA